MVCNVLGYIYVAKSGRLYLFLEVVVVTAVTYFPVFLFYINNQIETGA